MHSSPAWQELQQKFYEHSLPLDECQAVSSLRLCVYRVADHGRAYWLTLKAGASAARSSSSLPALRSCSLAAFFCLARSLRDSFALPCCLPSPSAAQSLSASQPTLTREHQTCPAKILASTGRYSTCSLAKGQRKGARRRPLKKQHVQDTLHNPDGS